MAAEETRELLKVSAQIGGLLRQATRGDCYHELLASRPELRLRHRCDAAFRELSTGAAAKEPAFESPEFTQHLQYELRSLRGRELPGLVNSHFFFNFMVLHVEQWRPAVAAACEQVYAAVRGVCHGLCAELAPPALRERAAAALTDALEPWLETTSEAVAARLNDAFTAEADPFVRADDADLVAAVVSVRCARFEKALAHVSGIVTENTPLPAGGGGKPADKPATEAAAAAPASAAAAAVPSTAAARRAREADPMAAAKAMLLEGLSPWYMANHGVDSASMVEDMRALLAAYYNVAAKRLMNNVCMTLERLVLDKLPAEVEGALFTRVQTGPLGVPV